MARVAARMNAQPIGTKCRIPVATGKAAQLVVKRVARRACATRYRRCGGFDLFASRRNAVTIIREITFALLTALGAVAGSELIVRMWHFLKMVL